MGSGCGVEQDESSAAKARIDEGLNMVLVRRYPLAVFFKFVFAICWIFASGMKNFGSE